MSISSHSRAARNRSAVSSAPCTRKTKNPTATHAAAHTKTAAAAMSFASYTMLSKPRAVLSHSR